jgi:hypothetical protein
MNVPFTIPRIQYPGDTSRLPVSSGYACAMEKRDDDAELVDPAAAEKRKKLAERITLARNLRRLTNDQVGAAIGGSGNAFNVAVVRLAGGKRPTDPKLDWAEKVAAALGVSLDWLATGRGDMFGGVPEDIPPDPVYPNRRVAIASARMVRVSPEAIEKVCRETPARDLSDDQWLDRILTENRTIHGTE